MASQPTTQSLSASPEIHGASGARVQSVDALRGLVMIIMALDHVRDYFHVGAMSFQPDDLTRTTAALFFTRWITHLCAPVFAFTAGAGAFLWSRRSGNLERLPRFLWTRGLWLVLLDLTLVRFAMFFSLTKGPVILLVLWSLGWSMVMLSLLVRLPLRAVAIISLAVIALHNLLDPIQAASLGSFAWLWNVLHQTGVVPVRGLIVVTGYPVLPWIAVMAAGYCFGVIVSMDPERRQAWLLRIGLAAITAFAVLRWLNLYGDPQPWSPQSSAGLTLLSFLRTAKYPPSLLFLLMTLGPAMLIWEGLERLRLGRSNPLLVFGRTPLFYFVIHIFVIHALTYVFAWIRYGNADFLANPPPSLGGSAALYPPGYGYELATVYAIWLLVVLLMYVPCLYFARLKERRRSWWLSYL
jgi:uncharacterized membrane protein